MSRYSRDRNSAFRGKTLTRILVFCLGVIFAVGANTVIPNESDLLVADKETAERLGFQEKIYRGEDGDFLVEFISNRSAKCMDSSITVPGERTWDLILRGVLYLVALLYTFLGIAIVSDIFMSSIEKITAAKTVVKVNEDGTSHTITVVVWNETVANLTLMALGSSAPEILMACIETIQTMEDPLPGELGASTIVGSAAFNLFVITGVCVYYASEPKKVKEVGVFLVTSTASMFAYFWMIVTLVIWTPDVVTIEEGVLTLLFFPLLVMIAFFQDRGWFRKGTNTPVEQKIVSAQIDAGQMDRENIQQLWRTMKREGLQLSEESELEELQLLVRAKELEKQQLKAGLHAAHWSRAQYRMNAIRHLAKKPCFIEHKSGREKQILEQQSIVSPSNDQIVRVDSRDNTKDLKSDNIEMRKRSCTNTFQKLGSNATVIEWSSATYSVVENEGRVKLAITRSGNLDETSTVKYHTKSGTALPVVKYEEAEGTIVFDPHELRKDVYVSVIDDKQYQEDQYFFVVLDNPSLAVLGEKRKAEVTIIDDDLPGKIEFLKPYYCFPESCGVAIITLVRRHGSDGKVSVRVSPTDGTATNNKDFEFTEGRAEFEHEETMATIAIPITDDSSYEKNETFQLTIDDPQGGALIGRVQQCQISILNDDGVTQLIDTVMGKLATAKANMQDKMESSSWAQLFRDAVTLAAEEDEELSSLDYALHFLTIFWKVIFAFIPPTSYAGGWATFVCALLFIGMIVVFVAECATLFGCVCGLPDPITAITFVALGTSLPDLFASKTAVDEEDYADAAIGNITGSNSVNVFLGLGLPWVIASIYKSSKGDTYNYPAGSLSFSVIIFLICAVLCLSALALNRKLYGGELGGPNKAIICGFMCSLWFVYVIMSSLKEKGKL